MISRKIKPYFQLVRLPNVFTAAADSLAGWLWVGGDWRSWAVWLPLAMSSMAIYAAGIALNDVFDLKIDRDERPNRPLPSGAVSVRFAAVIGIFLLAIGFVSTWSCLNPSAAIVAFTLIAAVLAYDLGVKRSVLGPEVMGFCRALNVFMGMAAGTSHSNELKAGAMVAVAIGLFVVGLTWISRSETYSGCRSGLAAGICLQTLSLVLLGYSAPGITSIDPPASLPALNIALGLSTLVLVALVVGRAAWNAWREAFPSRFQLLVKTSVLSLVWLDVAIVATRRGPLDALAIAALWIPAFVLGRWIYST